MRFARNWAAPDAPCRITTMSMRIASRLRAVSTSVSPFSTREDDCVFAVELLDQDIAALAGPDVDLFPDDVRRDGELPSPTVYHHGQCYSSWPTKVRKLVERGADGAAGIEHVVHDDDVLSVDVDGDTRGTDDGSRADGLEIVAVQRDVERALRDRDALA